MKRFLRTSVLLIIMIAGGVVIWALLRMVIRPSVRTVPEMPLGSISEAVRAAAKL